MDKLIIVYLQYKDCQLYCDSLREEIRFEKRRVDRLDGYMVRLFPSEHGTITQDELISESKSSERVRKRRLKSSMSRLGLTATSSEPFKMGSIVQGDPTIEELDEEHEESFE